MITFDSLRKEKKSINIFKLNILKRKSINKLLPILTFFNFLIILGILFSYVCEQFSIKNINSKNQIL